MSTTDVVVNTLISAGQRIAELERMAESFVRECNDTDKVMAQLGLSVDQARTEGGSLRVAFICNHIQETLDALADTNGRRITLFNENTDLRKQLAAEKERADYAWRNTNTIEKARQELARENAELRKDAERYRWLRDTHGYSYGMGSDTPAECGIAFGWQQSCPEESLWGIEQAIDAAIASEKENERG